MIDTETEFVDTEKPNRLPKDAALGYTPGRMVIPAGALLGMPTYPHDWPEWAKVAAFAVDVMTSKFQRGTSEYLRDNQDERGMIAEGMIFPDHPDGSKIVATDKGQPITAYGAMVRYAKSRPGPSIEEMQTWARNEFKAVRALRWKRLHPNGDGGPRGLSWTPRAHAKRRTAGGARE